MKKSLITVAMLSACALVQAETNDTVDLAELAAINNVTTQAKYTGLVSPSAFTISFDVSNVEGSGYLLSLTTQTSVNGAWRRAGISITSEGYLQLIGVGGDSYTKTTELSTSSLNATTLTLVGTKGDNKTAILTLYADGIQLDTVSTPAASNWFDDNNEGNLNIAFGNYGNSTNYATATYSNVYYSASTALTAEQVSSIVVNKSVPEPATASLSLLALGALALRRRRQ